MNLAELQRSFCECLRDDSAGNALPIAGDGLRVYRNNYREQLRSSLKSGFPFLLLWLGDSEFERAADVHIANHSPNSWTLDHYGYDFPATLQALFPDDPEVPELGWLDWAMAEALVAPDESPITPADLVELDWDSAHIEFVGSLRIAEARSNAADIWAALEERKTDPAPALSSERHALLVWRAGLLPCFRRVPIIEHCALSVLMGGGSFADACEMLRQGLGDLRAISAAGEMLARWLSDQMIARIDSPGMALVANFEPATN